MYLLWVIIHTHKHNNSRTRRFIRIYVLHQRPAQRRGDSKKYIFLLVIPFEYNRDEHPALTALIFNKAWHFFLVSLPLNFKYVSSVVWCKHIFSKFFKQKTSEVKDIKNENLQMKESIKNYAEIFISSHSCPYEFCIEIWLDPQLLYIEHYYYQSLFKKIFHAVIFLLCLTHDANQNNLNFKEGKKNHKCMNKTEKVSFIIRHKWGCQQGSRRWLSSTFFPYYIYK